MVSFALATVPVFMVEIAEPSIKLKFAGISSHSKIATYCAQVVLGARVRLAGPVAGGDGSNLDFKSVRLCVPIKF